MAWTIQPGRPFWSFIVAFCSNMGALVAADKLALYVEVDSWWAAILMSVFVGGVMYGKAKLDELNVGQGLPDKGSGTTREI